MQAWTIAKCMPKALKAISEVTQVTVRQTVDDINTFDSGIASDEFQKQYKI